MDLKRFKISLNLNKIDNPLVGPIIIHEHLKNSKLVQGWVKIPGEDKPCWHLWVECDGEKHDIHLFDADFIPEYIYEAPDNFDKDPQTVNQLDKYINCPRDFWRNQKKGSRSKLLSNLNSV